MFTTNYHQLQVFKHSVKRQNTRHNKKSGGIFPFGH